MTVEQFVEKMKKDLDDFAVAVAEYIKEGNSYYEKREELSWFDLFSRHTS